MGGGAALSAQTTTATITGKVTDATGAAPLVGASVRVTGTQIGAQTGDDGRYTIRGVRPGAVDLQVNRIGYEVKHVRLTVTAGQTATQDVTLAQAAFSLAEVVTTVTGTQSKAEVANTVATIDASAKAQETTANTLGQMISGQAAGVQIVSAGAAGGGSRIRIRGQSSLSLSNQPVVYVDGVKVYAEASEGSATGQSRFDDLNPDEIENIEILKGPAAATLYGTEAANGVINITTKKGRAGATRWSAFTEQGYSHDPSYGKYRDLWISFDTQQSDKNGPLPCVLTNQIAGKCTIDSTYHGNVLNNPATTPIVNGNVQKYGLQVSGGSQSLQYFVSGEYNREMGPYKMPQAEISRLEAERGAPVPYRQIHPNADGRVNLRSNLSTQLGSKADFNVSVGYLERADRQPPNEDNSTGLMVDAIAGLARTDLCDGRDKIARGSNPNCLGLPLNGYRSYPMGDILSPVSQNDVNRFTNAFNARYYPVSWLNMRANLGYDATMSHSKRLVAYNQGPCCGSGRDGSISSSRTEHDQYTVDLGATANFNPFSRVSTKSSVGMQYYRTYSDNTTAGGSQLSPGVTQTSQAAVQSSSESTSATITLGTYGEEVLSYADRIFLTGGLRYDGNSAFGKSFKGVFYPKVGLSWLLSQEGFFPKWDALNTFRVRGTFGTSGVQPGNTSATRYFSSTAVTYNGSDLPGVRLGSVGNANLKPEYSTEFETGFDATLFQSKTSIEFTYYRKKTKDALIQRPLAPSLSGLGSRWDNLGSIRNEGKEVTLNQRFIDNNQIGLDLQITGSTNKNRILTLGEGVTPVSTGNRDTQYNAPGYPLFGLWGKTINYNDANGDGLLAVNEVSVSDTAVYFAPSYPTFEMAINPRLELFHRKLAIAAQVDHKQGMDKFNNTLRHQSQGGLSAKGFWDPQATLWEQARTIAVNNYATYSGMYENGRFTRLREVTVSYQMPDKLAQSIHASRATIVLMGRNLHVWTPYSGVDPEATVGNGDERGNEEYFSTPPLRYFTVRLNLNF
jgi:TonB-linked SusC/RagA family outer membrane protein